MGVGISKQNSIKGSRSDPKGSRTETGCRISPGSGVRTDKTRLCPQTHHEHFPDDSQALLYKEPRVLKVCNYIETLFNNLFPMMFKLTNTAS